MKCSTCCQEASRSRPINPCVGMAPNMYWRTLFSLSLTCPVVGECYDSETSVHVSAACRAGATAAPSGPGRTSGLATASGIRASSGTAEVQQFRTDLAVRGASRPPRKTRRSMRWFTCASRSWRSTLAPLKRCARRSKRLPVVLPRWKWPRCWTECAPGTPTISSTRFSEL